MRIARGNPPASTRSKRRLLLLVALLAGCASPGAGPTPTPIESLQAVQLPPDGQLSVVATTTLVGDLLRQVGGESINLHVMLTPGRDPHSYQTTPGDMRAASGAAVIFVSGFGLEGNMLVSLADSLPTVPMVDLSQGLHPINAGGTSVPPGIDPHVWLDPKNVIRWAENGADALSRLDPGNETRYFQNASLYTTRLQALDDWIQDEIESIPAERRLLVTDHHMLDTFARRYNFDIVGTIVPGYSSEAEPSSRELARLEDTVRQAGARAIFVEDSINPQLARIVASDTGLELVMLYIGSLSGPQGPASNYIELMRYNVQAIVQALQQPE